MVAKIEGELGYGSVLSGFGSLELVMEVYRLTQDFPRQEIFGLMSQLRRSAVSIPSNIAEGQGRLSKGEFRNFLGNARGSLSELETQVLIAEKLNFLQKSDAADLLHMAAEVGRILNGLIASTRTPNPNPNPKPKIDH